MFDFFTKCEQLSIFIVIVIFQILNKVYKWVEGDQDESEQVSTPTISI